MSEKKSPDDDRAKYLAALEKKKQQGIARNAVGPADKSKIGGAAGNTTKRFQRKSGSA